MKVSPFSMARHTGRIVALWKETFGSANPGKILKRLIEKKVAKNGGHMGWIYSLVVLPDMQREGIGPLLMGYVERELEARGGNENQPPGPSGQCRGTGVL
jgi:GNAT superfamily N-acetyltransferase